MEFQERRDSTEIFIRFIMKAISKLEDRGSFNPSVRCIESQAYQQWISDKLIFEKPSVDSNILGIPSRFSTCYWHTQKFLKRTMISARKMHWRK